MNVLDVQNIYKAFGGLQATNNVSLTVAKGEIVAVIGPNGAGKSTIFNQISGYFAPDEGKILFEGRNIIGLPPQEIVRLGIGRSFQRSNIFPRLTTFENVQTAVLSYENKALHFFRPTRSYNEVNARVQEILEAIGLQDSASQLAGKLSLGDQKRLEIGLALSMRPKMMLLDEPTAGMSPEETVATVQLVEHLAHQYGMSLLFTEHDMSVVFGISQRIYVLHQGQIIAEGKPQDISKNPEVQRVYLGDDVPHQP